MRITPHRCLILFLLLLISQEPISARQFDHYLARFPDTIMPAKRVAAELAVRRTKWSSAPDLALAAFYARTECDYLEDVESLLELGAFDVNILLRHGHIVRLRNLLGPERFAWGVIFQDDVEMWVAFFLGTGIR
jgi:hypothetical protein